NQGSQKRDREDTGAQWREAQWHVARSDSEAPQNIGPPPWQMKGCPLPAPPITVSIVPVRPALRGSGKVDQASDQASEPPAAAAAARGASSANIRTGTAGVIYIIAFITGGIVMSFEMLGSRYLNPYFGSGIYTWAALISTVLAALTLGYFLGGWLADRTASATVLGTTVLVASLYFLALPTFSDALLEFLLADIDDVRAGSLVASLAILLFPVTLLGMYSPFAIRLMLHSAERSGTVSGTVYGVSTAGSIVGTLG